ncbi:MAG: carboxypeptidase regulatory-like domain-containing protein [Bacteroidota bacterium]
MKTISKFAFLLLIIALLSNVSIIAQSGWSDPSGDMGQPIMEMWIYGANSVYGSLESGDQVAVFDGELLVGLLTLGVSPDVTNWNSSRLIIFSKNTSGQLLYEPGHPLLIKCWDASENAPVGEIGYAHTWGDNNHIDFHNEWYAPTSDIQATAATYGAYFPQQGGYSYCYVDLTFTDVPVNYYVSLVVTVWDDQTPGGVVTDAVVTTDGITATNNGDGTYTLQLYAGPDVTPPEDFNYTVNITSPTFESETFEYIVQGNNNGGSGYSKSVYLNCKGNISGTVKCYNLVTSQYDIFAVGAVVSTTIGSAVYSDATDIDGNYLIENIPDGEWTFNVTYAGYATVESNVTIENNITSTHNVNLDLSEGTIEGTIFSVTTLFPITDETIKISLFDNGGNEVDNTTTNANGEYTLSHYPGTYDIVVEDNNVGTSPDFQAYTLEDYILGPEVTEEIDFNLLPDPYISNYEVIDGNTNRSWTIYLEMAKFGVDFLLPYDELVIFDTGQDPIFGSGEPGKRVGVLHFSEIGSYQNCHSNVLMAYSQLSNGNCGFVTGNNMEFWAYNVSHDAIYEIPVEWWFNTGVGTYSGTTFPDSLGNHTSYLNIYWNNVDAILNGTVSKAAGAGGGALSGASVEALNIYTHEIVASTTTDSDGLYTLFLEVGAYDIQFSKEGWFPETHEDFVIAQNPPNELDMVLDIQVQETITYEFDAQGYYFIGRCLTVADNSMLTLLNNNGLSGGVSSSFESDYHNSWIENDGFVVSAPNKNKLDWNGTAWKPDTYLWEELEGYQLYIEDAYTFDMQGNVLRPENNPIVFPSAGIYYVAYYPYDVNNPDEALVAFASIFNELDWVMDSKGNRLHHDNGSWVDNIQLLTPGESFKVKMNGAATLTYPLSAKKIAGSRSIAMDPTYFVYSGGDAATWTYTIYIDTYDFDIGDEFAAFSEGVMVGSMVIDSEDPWENDLNTFYEAVNGGYGINTPIELIAYDVSENIDYNVDFEVIDINNACYPGNTFPAGLDQFSYVQVSRGTVRVDENQINNFIKLYPNPTSGIFNIESASKIDELNIFNIHGVRVVTKIINSRKYKVEVGHLVPGSYIIQMKTDTGITTKRVIVK